MKPYKTLLTRSAVALPVCAFLVILCYVFLDKPVAFFVHDHKVNKQKILKVMAETAMVFNALAPAILVLAAIKLAWSPLNRLETTLVAASVSLIIAVAMEYYLKFLFGRYWPETWINDNPSLIQDGAYGFHPFHFDVAYGSFPSGHTARAVAFLSVVWITYPRWRWLCAAICTGVIVGLVGMNYHFVGDTVGGAFLGSVTGMYVACFFNLGSGQQIPGPPVPQLRSDHGIKEVRNDLFKAPGSG
jgi:membrane-associated phospholipid phosphatase